MWPWIKRILRSDCKPWNETAVWATELPERLFLKHWQLSLVEKCKRNYPSKPNRLKTILQDSAGVKLQLITYKVLLIIWPYYRFRTSSSSVLPLNTIKSQSTEAIPGWQHTYFEGNSFSWDVGNTEDFTKRPLAYFHTLFHTLREDTLLPRQRAPLATLSEHFLCIRQLRFSTLDLEEQRNGWHERGKPDTAALIRRLEKCVCAFCTRELLWSSWKGRRLAMAEGGVANRSWLTSARADLCGVPSIQGLRLDWFGTTKHNKRKHKRSKEERVRWKEKRVLSPPKEHGSGLPLALRWTDRAALMRLQVCVSGVKSANREERLSRLTLRGEGRTTAAPSTS